MRIFEVDTGPGATPEPDKLLGLVNFLNGRAEDTNAQKQISRDAFMNLARSLGVNITPGNLETLVGQPPLSNLLEPLDPNSNVISFKGAGEPNSPEMPVNKAQDIVAAAAKKAANKDRGV